MPMRGQIIRHQHGLEARRNRELALKSCDIIDLANLPEDDRHLASRELELRRLYVALRMRLEVRAGDDADDKTLEALEQRRSRGWGQAQWQYSGEEGRVSLGERLGEVRRLVVLGDPGAGKSTLLRWLATAYLLRLQQHPDWRDLPDVASLPERDWLPILIRCRDLPPEATDCLETMLQHSLRKSEFPTQKCTDLCALLRDKLKQGEALLLVDGLDEITEPRARARFSQQIETISQAYEQAPLIVTSRIVGYREMGYRLRAGFEHLTVADLSREDKDDFARRWCALTERPERQEDATEELIRDMHSNDRIERLTGNPMLLTTMALIKRKLNRLPQRRVDLYEKAVEVLLNWRSAVDLPLDPREALPQLEYLAHAMCAQGIQQIREDQVLDLLRQVREEYPNIHPLRQHSPEEFLGLLERRTGLLIQSGHTRHKGRSVPVYEFRHLTFQEYLAGIALLQGHYQGWDKNKSLAEMIAPLAGQMGNYIFIEDRIMKENWREALCLCVAACNDNDVDAILLAILRPLPGEIGTARSRALQAALCLADEPNASEDVANDVLIQLIERMKDLIGDAYSIDDDLIFELSSSRWTKLLEEYLFNSFFQCKRKEEHFYGICYEMVIQNKVSFEKASVFILIAEQAVKKSTMDSNKIYRLFIIVWERLYHFRHRSRSGASVSFTPKLQEIIAEIYAIGEEPAVNVLKKIYSQDTEEKIRRAALGSMAQNCKEETDRKLLSEHFGGVTPFLNPQSPITAARIAQAAERLKQSQKKIASRYAKLAQYFGLILEPEVFAIAEESIHTEADHPN
ncbi:PBS lyase HEAT-like repeat-containing protein [Candidatus Electrothrix aarhusensis]